MQEYDAGKTKYSVQKEADLLQQKCKTQGSATQNIKYQLTSSTENEKIEELKRKPMHRQYCWDLERPSVDKEKSLVWFCS